MVEWRIYVGIFVILCYLKQDVKAENKFKLPTRFVPPQEDVGAEFGDLAAKYKPLDLGVGSPDFPPSEDIRVALSQVARSSDYHVHQYARSSGVLRLVRVLSKLYSKLIGRHIDPMTEILPTIGATEALISTIYGHVEVGDEVILIEPFYTPYEAMVKSAGGIARFIPLRLKEKNGTGASDWVLDQNELESLFNNKTKAIILNTPNNPLGKVFKLKELENIARLCKMWDVLVISDEVYEWYAYKPNKHIRIASLPGMWNRTITIGSAGKTFKITGWRLGWAYGPTHLLSNLQIVHSNLVDSATTPIQEAVAIVFEKALNDDNYFESIAAQIKAKSGYMVKSVTDAGMKPVIPEGGYFLTVDWSPLESRVDLKSENGTNKDDRFTKWMIKNVGLLGLPVSSFYGRRDKSLGENFMRFCIVKRNKTLEKANELLKKWES